MAGTKEVSQLLVNLKLSEYTSVLISEGFDDLKTLFQITESDLYDFRQLCFDINLLILQ